MSIEFNHTILATQDANGSALFLAEMLGLQPPRRCGPFWMVTTDNGVNLDTRQRGRPIKWLTVMNAAHGVIPPPNNGLQK